MHAPRGHAHAVDGAGRCRTADREGRSGWKMDEEGRTGGRGKHRKGMMGWEGRKTTHRVAGRWRKSDR